MNMKKTIAAVAASAVAVSAMATSVSAIDVLEHGTSDLEFAPVTLKYDLVKKETVKGDNAVTVMAYFDGVEIAATDDAIVLSIENVAAIAGAKVDAVKSIKVTGYYLDENGNATSTLPAINYVTDKGANLYNAQLSKADGTLRLDLAAHGMQNPLANAGETKANITVTYELATTLKDQAAVNDGLNFTNKCDAAKATIVLSVVEDAAQVVAPVANATVGDTYLTAGSVIVKIGNNSAVPFGKYVYHNAKWYAAADAGYATPITGIENVGASAEGDTVEIIKKDVAPAKHLVGDIYHGTPRITDFVNNDKEQLRPFVSFINDGRANNVVDGVHNTTQSVSDRLWDCGYKNWQAEINDLVANYDEVVFTFNTAAQPVKVNNDNVLASYYDADGDKTYTKFIQHLYPLYGDDQSRDKEYTGYINYDWNQYNLFSGALVINDVYSMSLNDTTYFDVGESSISFPWENLNNGAAVNPVVNYVWNIDLVTSRVWFWDNLVVTGAMTEAEDASTAEGTEAEEETIEEAEEEEEEVVEEEETEEEPVVEEEEPAAPAENPATGNAPIALAVIPVALAAAAVVAKKRG